MSMFFVITCWCFYTAEEAVAQLGWSVDFLAVSFRDWMTLAAGSQGSGDGAPGR